MKYLEELEPGDSFNWEDKYYIVSSDYKNNGQRDCINLSNGFNKWFKPDEIVEICPIYILDTDNNIISVKPTEK
jgi:hypothetical protein